MIYDVAVLGAGASGMACAVTAANRGLNVLVLEKNIEPGRKLRATGNGRCNIANDYFDDTCYRGNDKALLYQMIQPDSCKKVLNFFQGLGLAITDKNGYYYPASLQASSVVNVLNRAMEHAGVTCCYGRQVTDVCRENDRFRITAALSQTYKKEAARAAKKNKKTVCDIQIEKDADFVYEAENLVLATGGYAGPQYGCMGEGYLFAGKFGHHIVNAMPALVPLISDAGFCNVLSGVRVSGEVAIYIDGQKMFAQRGEIQFTDYGVSGICVFGVSRFAAKALALKKSVALRFHFMPQYSDIELINVLGRLFDSTEYLSVLDCLRGLLPEKLAGVILSQCGVDKVLKAGHLKEEQRQAICAQIMGFEMHITGCKDYDMAQVTAGGVELHEITPDYESKHQKGLYLVGELLDVDGTCGGYNLTFAFLSGIAAGEAVGVSWARK